MEKWRIPFASREFQFNHTVWQYCPVLWPPNGQCSINSASDEQAGQQNQKWGGGPRCMNYAYYITITLQYTVRQNNAVEIGLRLRYWTISCMVLAYLRSEIVLSFSDNSGAHMRFVCSHRVQWTKHYVNKSGIIEKKVSWLLSQGPIIQVDGNLVKWQERNYFFHWFSFRHQRQTNEMEQFTLSSTEMVFKQNMSETIICNHVALINPEEKRINENARDLLGYNTFSVCIRPQTVARDTCSHRVNKMKN